MIHWILPIVGIFLALLTKKGMYKDINTLLACLLIFIFGYELHVINPENGYWDGTWHDAFLFGLYGFFACIFHKAGGRKQALLALTGMIAHAGYGLVGFYSSWHDIYFNPKDFYYTQAFITLTVVQLMYASDGVAFTALYEKIKKIGGRNGDNSHGSGGSPLRSGDG